ncbi:hypothetical protein K440DRAFT_184921 [Wilcoxina mikolae CBS 423.85]|nr:hypothetical protein K440DRAFT_184921 [Wilcoxina mikolae CBS 423.85]
MERASYGSRPRAHDDHMRSPDPECFEAHGHLIHPIPPPPPPPGLRSTPGLPHRSDHRSDLGRPPPTTLRRPSYERRCSENLDDDGWFGPPSPGIEEFSGNARGTHGVHVHSTSGRRAIVEYVPPGRVSPQYSPVPVEIETGRRRYHPNRIPRDGEHILALQHGIDSSRIDHTPPHTRLPISNRIKPANPYAKENSPNQRSDIHADYRGSSPHRQSEPYYSEHSHIHDGPRPELGRSGPTSPRHDKSPEGGRIHSQVRYLGANSAFIGDISRAPTEPYGYLDSHPASPPRRTEPLYSTSPSYRAPAPAPLPSPIKLRDPAGRVYSFPFNQCKKWGVSFPTLDLSCTSVDKE